MKKLVNPYTKEEVYALKELNKAEIEQALSLAGDTFKQWRNTNFQERSQLMHQAAKELKQHKQEYAEVITKEMGKPITQAISEIEKCAWVCEYYADHAEQHLQNEIIKTDAAESYVSFEPIGVVLAIMPWNYPFWQVFRFAAPALMAGNIGILKHASNTMKSGEMIERVFKRAGFPDGCFQNLVIAVEEVEDIIKNNHVKAVTLTGSKPAGATVAGIASQHIKKSVLELGGSNALVVFDDADLQAAVETCVQARFQNTGQSCIAGKRLLLQRNIAPLFTKHFVDRVRELKSGNPMEKDTYIGVMAREDLAEGLEDQVNKSVAMGAELLLGGQRKGTYFEPTILNGVSRDMPVFKEETFGPAIGITIFDTEDDAVDLVNASEFGLGVSLFTSDMEKAKRLIPLFDDGAVFVNQMVKSDPRLPFGGTKISGYGRELSSHGIMEFINKKTVYLK